MVSLQLSTTEEMGGDIKSSSKNIEKNSRNIILNSVYAIHSGFYNSFCRYQRNVATNIQPVHCEHHK